MNSEQLTANILEERRAGEMAQQIIERLAAKTDNLSSFPEAYTVEQESQLPHVVPDLYSLTLVHVTRPHSNKQTNKQTNVIK